LGDRVATEIDGLHGRIWVTWGLSVGAVVRHYWV
jgi:hypothetical protein